MAEPLNVLVVEDNPDDAELIARELHKAGFDLSWRRVDTEAGYLEALGEGIDLILSDFRMPTFGGLRALGLLKERGLEIPFILISGTIGEETAVEAMRLGASDYLLKDRLGRLGPAAVQALRAGRMRRERRQAEEALRQSEERFRELAENIHEVFWMSDPHKRQILYISPAYERIWGRTCASLYAAPSTWLDAVHPADRSRIAEAVATRQPAGTYDEEYRIRRPDGTERWIRDRAFAVRGPDGAIQRIVGVAEDTTEAKRLREQFLRAQRMEAIGTLAGGIAHDLNNILAPVLMVPGLLKDSAKTEEERRLLDLVEKGARRGSNIIRQLLTFSRGAGGERIPVQLRHLCKEMADLMRETFPRDISIETGGGRDLWPVRGDPTQLHQVIMNLCVNARDAMPNGGRLTLALANTRLDQAAVAGHPAVAPGPFVEIKVSDTGAGIAPENIERIFDPFFTTKPLTKGTGLGLSTVLGIVRSHNGFVTVSSAVGKGTDFAVYVPAVPDAEGVRSGPDAEAPSRGRGELILVVDDEEPVRTATSLLLQQYGYRVVVASDGARALEEFRRANGAIRLVVTDVMMPVMGGIALIRELRAIEPGIRVLATSGLTDQANHSELNAVGVGGIVEKPCCPNDLLAAIDGLLNPDPESP
jgi:PAS domain S-box-containing protein